MHLRTTILIGIITCLSTITEAQDTTTADRASKDKEAIVEKPEKKNDFDGGEGAWNKFIKKNLRYEVPISMGAPEGTYKITVSFVINTDGTLSDFKPVSHYGYGMEAELIRVLKKSPKWIPAVQEGRPVRSKRTQTVNFDIVTD